MLIFFLFAVFILPTVGEWAAPKKHLTQEEDPNG